jgi:hypothetical protein
MEFTTDELIDDFDAIQMHKAKFKWNMLIPLTIYACCYIFHRKIVTTCIVNYLIEILVFQYMIELIYI